MNELNLSANAELERLGAEQVEQTLRNALPRFLGLGLTVEQVADALALSVNEVRRFVE